MDRVGYGDHAFYRYSCGQCEATFSTPEQAIGPFVDTLRNRDYGEDTPIGIPGGKVITPEQAYTMIRKQNAVVLSALDEPYGVPDAITVHFAAGGGSFEDATQKH